MRTIFDEFSNAYTDLSSYVRRTNEMAKIEVLLFADKDGVVRTILRRNTQAEKTFYDMVILDD